MSNLSILPIGDYRKTYELTALIETGTEGGEGVNTALRAGFPRVLSCEVSKKLFFDGIKRFKDDERVILFNGLSTDILPTMLKLTAKERILFWLDAHLPNQHFPDREYNKSVEVLPLREEIRIILENRDVSNDVIIIDDLKLYDRRLREEGWLEKIVGKFKSPFKEFTDITDLFPNHDWTVMIKQDYALVIHPKE